MRTLALLVALTLNAAASSVTSERMQNVIVAPVTDAGDHESQLTAVGGGPKASAILSPAPA